MAVAINESTAAGVLGASVDTFSLAVVISGIATDTTLYASMRENGNIVNLDKFSANQVPEPRAALLGGLGMLALLRRRR